MANHVVNSLVRSLGAVVFAIMDPIILQYQSGAASIKFILADNLVFPNNCIVFHDGFQNIFVTIRHVHDIVWLAVDQQNAWVCLPTVPIKNVTLAG